MWGRKRASKQKMVEERGTSKDKKIVPVLQPPSFIAPGIQKLSYQHPKGYMKGDLKGMNTKPFRYSIMTTGNSIDQNLFTIDSAAVLDGHQGILSITGFKLTMFNLPQVDAKIVPQVFYLSCDQLSGMTQPNGASSSILAAVTPAAITSATDGLGLSTFSMIFGMESDSINWDIGSIPLLTFRLLIGMDKTEATYPTQTEILVEFTITKILI